MVWVVLVLLPSLFWFFVLETSTCFGLAFGCPSKSPLPDRVAAEAEEGEGEEEDQDASRAWCSNVLQDRAGCTSRSHLYHGLMDTMGKKSLMDLIVDEYSRHSEEAALVGYQHLVDELLASATTEAVTANPKALAHHSRRRRSSAIFSLQHRDAVAFACAPREEAGHFGPAALVC